MWKLWLLFDPRRILVALGTFLAILAFGIHFLLLSTDKYGWLEGVKKMPSAQATPAAPQK
jgi:light-harvesting complex 1 alpha chain